MHRRGPSARFCFGVMLALLALQAGALYLLGQPTVSRSGALMLWAGNVRSAENSQQLTDWYTFSHVIHGVIFYALARLLFPRLGAPARLALAVGAEVSWELLENSPWVIDRYREQALAQGYYGDSILNSLSDTLAMASGFLLAAVAPVRFTLLLVAGLELFTLVEIHDSLLLNVVQLIHPVAAIARWQASLAP